MLTVDRLNHPNLGGSGGVGSLWGRLSMITRDRRKSILSGIMSFSDNQDVATLAGLIIEAHPGNTPTRPIPVKGTSFYPVYCADLGSLGVALCYQKRGRDREGLCPGQLHGRF